MIKRSGALVECVKGFSPYQIVFVILSDRSRAAAVLAVDIGKDPLDRLARRYRRGVGPAHFPNAIVRAAALGPGVGEITILPQVKR